MKSDSDQSIEKTDKEIWKAHFDKYGVKFQESNGASSCDLETDNGNGYNGFSLIVEFDNNGKFINYGVWE